MEKEVISTFDGKDVIDGINRCCNTCFKHIDKTDPYMILSKGNKKRYLCDKHFKDSEKFKSWNIEKVGNIM